MMLLAGFEERAKPEFVPLLDRSGSEFLFGTADRGGEFSLEQPMTSTRRGKPVEKRKWSDRIIVDTFDGATSARVPSAASNLGVMLLCSYTRQQSY